MGGINPRFPQAIENAAIHSVSFFPGRGTHFKKCPPGTSSLIWTLQLTNIALPLLNAML